MLIHIAKAHQVDKVYGNMPTVTAYIENKNTSFMSTGEAWVVPACPCNSNSPAGACEYSKNNE